MKSNAACTVGKIASSACVCVCVCGVLKFVGGMQDRVAAAGQLRYNVLALFQRRRRRRLRHAEGPATTTATQTADCAHGQIALDAAATPLLTLASCRSMFRFTRGAPRSLDKLDAKLAIAGKSALPTICCSPKSTSIN